ncbi:hypothetical protein GGI07_005719 [Coemansia sp. Benny D115]|nr:hypothetical protein GGI07_005719 [Coemansia sp. Benny D115]
MSLLLDSFTEARRQLVERAASQPRTQVYLGLVFKAYYLRDTGDFALAYFFLIMLGIVERLIAFSIDSIRDKPGQPWRIFPRACLYYVATMFRYVLMIAVMNTHIPTLLVTCLGLALGQIIIEGIRYYLMMRRIRKKAEIQGFVDSSSKTSESLADSREQHKTTHVNESCC